MTATARTARTARPVTTRNAADPIPARPDAAVEVAAKPAKPAKATKPVAPVAAPAKPAAKPLAPCRCGCGSATVRPAAAYLSGHDARHAGAVGRRLLAAPATIDHAALVIEFAGSVKLADKAIGFVAAAHARTARKATEAAARKVATAAARDAYKAAMATA